MAIFLDKATIEDLRKQLEMITRRKNAVEEQLQQQQSQSQSQQPQSPPQSPQRQVQQLVSDSIPPAAIPRSIPATSQGRPIPPPPPPPVTPIANREDPLDAQRLKNLQEINATLKAFSRDSALQADLQRPLVKVSSFLSSPSLPSSPRSPINIPSSLLLDINPPYHTSVTVITLPPLSPCYDVLYYAQVSSNLALVQVAMDLWKGKNPADMSTADVDAAKFDIGVVRIYPRLKEFEQACSAAAVVFPIDHVETARTGDFPLSMLLSLYSPNTPY